MSTESNFDEPDWLKDFTLAITPLGYHAFCNYCSQEGSIPANVHRLLGTNLHDALFALWHLKLWAYQHLEDCGK